MYMEEEIKKSTSKEKRVPKKASVDFENSLINDLEINVGKNINKKNQFQAQKRVKLLSHRFTQLENNVAQLYDPIQVYDVLGEVIGKKYDFRCNQAINTSGMLVDELTPYDFTRMLGSRVQKGRNSLSSYSEPKTPGTGTSGYQSATSLNDNEFITSTHGEFEEEQNFSLEVENVSLANESQILEKENVINRDHEIPFNNPNISQQFITEKIFLKRQHIQNNLLQDPIDSNDQNFRIHNCKEINGAKERYQSENSDQTIQIEEEYPRNDGKLKKFGITNQMTTDKQLGLISKDDRHQLVQVDELDNMQWKEGLLGLRKRGNQTSKISICSVDDINEFDWKPMPFIQGMKNIFFNNSSILKLPEYISLLETKFGSKKRKLASKMYKPESLTKLVLYEAESFTIKKKDFILQAKQKFKCLRKQELEDFMKNFDECLNGTEQKNNTSQYETTTGVTIDLLDFRISQNQNNFVENNIEEVTSRNSSPTHIKSQSANRHNSLDIADKSSTLCSNWYEPSISEIDLTYSLPDYQTLIEGKMKEIFEESNVTTELDQTVAKWHASLQPKLSEAEIRPTFRIHDYTSRIIGTLQALDQKKINFDSVVHDKPACEVARYFLASLQLANTYNVEIKTKNSGNSIEIALLNDGKEYTTC
ncbi:uncharacterized protein LOC143150894 isoform X2 [Ptiloglossa arizonensis]|uniref:uncharacterized protein LOC143150894 isoform X2 n=1 Tax=Ptiloglossa arizonensis TaxID=3350558 RepID=UPI003FA14E53